MVTKPACSLSNSVSQQKEPLVRKVCLLMFSFHPKFFGVLVFSRNSLIHMLVYVACLPQRTQPCDGASYRTRVSVFAVYVVVRGY
jgi:hypothetical protein